MCPVCHSYSKISPWYCILSPLPCRICWLQGEALVYDSWIEEHNLVNVWVYVEYNKSRGLNTNAIGRRPSPQGKKTSQIDWVFRFWSSFKTISRIYSWWMFHINGIMCRGEIGKIGEFLRGSILSCHSSPSYVRLLSYHKSAPKHITGWWFGTWILFFHILGILIPIDFHIFQRGRYTTNQIKTNFAEQDFPIFMAPFLSQSTCSYTLQDLFFPTCFLVFHYLHTCLQEFIFQCLFPLVSSF